MIFNPAAGWFPSGVLSERAANILRQYDWEITISPTRSGEHITTLARQAAERGDEAFFVVGGDGTMSYASRGLLGSDTALGVLPGGTGNVFVQELGMPYVGLSRRAAVEECARLLAQAPARRVDVGMLGGASFVLWGGVGLDAFAIRHIEPRGRWNKYFNAISFTASTIFYASFWHGMNVRAFADGKKVEGHYLIAVMSNIHLYVGGMAELSPSALLDDGRMDLWLFEGDTLGDAIRCVLEVLAEQHLESPIAHCIPYSSLYLEADTPLFVQVDAEPVEYQGNTIEVGIQRQALKVLMPSKPPRQLFMENNPV